MKKIIIAAVVAVAVIAAVIFFGMKFTVETGVLVPTVNNTNMYISEKTNEPIVMLENTKFLRSPQGGDKVLVLRAKWTEETFPGKTDVYLCVKTKSNYKEITAENYPELADMGWIKSAEKKKPELAQTVEFKASANDNGGYSVCTFKISSDWIYCVTEAVTFLPDIETEQSHGSTASARVYPKADKNESFTVNYYPNEDFAVCGTGLITNEITLESGLKATVGYYDGSTDWYFAALPENRAFVFLNNGLTGENALTALEIIKTVGISDVIAEEPTAVPATQSGDNTDTYKIVPMENPSGIYYETTHGKKTAAPPSDNYIDIEISENKVMSVFRIREINGNSLTMCKMDLGGKQEIKGGLYCGGTDKAESFKVGDVVSVVYDKLIGETFPYSIRIYDINIAVWN